MQYSLASTVGWLVAMAGCARALAAEPERPHRPHVLLILTDDQGWGDFGFHGNRQIRTPTLDQLARDGAELEWFYVSPVCSPTRASLLTGRYNYRTGAVDTNMGRSMMYGEEVTLAESLAAAGYRTAIFGKWHLGDNYPLRPIDQGFGEALVHRGGGIGQPADPPGNHYFDPVLQHNGRAEKVAGYASDIFTDAALDFIAQPSEQPFFVYLAYNCPHAPLEIAEKYWRPYAAQGLDEPVAKVYGMVANLDENLARLFAKLHEQGLDRDTIVMFLTDNGPDGRRFNGPLRDAKTTLYEGGIRVPCLVRWPGRIAAGKKVSQVAAHVDIAPTLIEACGARPPTGVRQDGRSLLGLLTAERADWPEREVFLQFHRGDVPEMFRGFAVRGPRYKLLQPLGGDPQQAALKTRFELYEPAADPGEQTDLADRLPEQLATMKAHYQSWFRDVSATRGFAPPRIVLGTAHENPSTLTRQDWRGPRAGWRNDSLGHWEVTIAAEGRYDVRVQMPPTRPNMVARLTLGAQHWEQPLPVRSQEHTFAGLRLAAGDARLEVRLIDGDTDLGPHYVDVTNRDLPGQP